MEGNKTLGQVIGTVKHSLSITNNANVKVDNITVYINYSTATDVDIKAWLNSNRVIAGQRSWRALSESEIKELDGMTFNATTIGTKVKSHTEQLNALVTTLVNAGIPIDKATELADAAMNDPSSLIINK